MLFIKKANVKDNNIKDCNEIDDLILQTKKMLEQMQNGNLNVRGETKNNESKEVISNINKMIEIVQDSINSSNERYESIIKTKDARSLKIEAEAEELRERLKFANKVAKIALWEKNIVNGDPMDENNTVIWSNEFRNLLGFSDEKDFPNVQSSWSDRIHPDAVELLQEAYEKHLRDRSGKTPYSLAYKIRLKNGEYRWFYSEAHTIRDKSGVPIKVVGSIRDISGEKAKEELESELTNKIESFSQSMRELVESIGKITITAQELAKYQENTMNASCEMRASADETGKVTGFIKNLSSKTNLLGLNASIEAARSGKEGLGFNVVATEIRKLSLSSSSAADQIGDSIKGMINLIESISINIENINKITQSQAAATEKISACVEELNGKAEDLLNLAKKITI